MGKILAVAAIVTLLGCAAARAETAQIDCNDETKQFQLRGTIVQTKITRHKYVETLMVIQDFSAHGNALVTGGAALTPSAPPAFPAVCCSNPTLTIH